MDKIDKGEIVYADIIIKDHLGKKYHLNKIVFSRNWECNYPILDIISYKRFLNLYNIPDKSEIINLNVISSTGFKHKNKSYTTARKNEQIRDDVTGAYG